MEEIQIVQDVQPTPLSESIQLEASPLSEAPIVVDLKTSLQRQLNTLWGYENEAENFTIFRTPHNISQTKKNLFEPSVISIGPFHHGQKHLRTLEEQKRRFLRDFLSREDHISLDLCISEMKLLEKRTRGCYSETFDLKSNEFVEMMLLDGCFLLEYFLKYHKKKSNYICDVGWNYHFIDRDLVLLENQIPFFIVEKLWEIGLKQEDRKNFVNELIYIFDQCLPYYYITNSIYRNPPPAEIHHLVHLCYHCFVPNLDKQKDLKFKDFLGMIPSATELKQKGLKFKDSSAMIPSATELKQKGLKFKENDHPKHILEISFQNGVLKIPKLSIGGCSKLLIANFIAFEHSKYGKEQSPFTCFVIFLNNLVNTPNDVRILQECGIIENLLGSEEELAHFINQVTEGSVIDGEFQYLAELYWDVNRYSESSWNKQRAVLIRNYFSSPWAAISLVAAFILLVLTFVQSFFAVYAYKVPPSS
ncbi:UPF0481 protein At3g47200-like [Carex rostrata]